MDIGLKSFVSEQQIEEKKKIRQELWLKERKPDEPLECPEEEYDPRTLYERLKEQRDRKQEEFDESRKLKHCIKVLDNDEVEFLDKVDEFKLNELKNKLDEERLAIEEFKKQVSDLTQAEQEKKLIEFKKSLFTKQTSKESTSSNQLSRSVNTRRQAKLLQNAVKRKTSDKDDKEEPNKRKKDESSNNKNNESNDGNDKNKQNDDDDNDNLKTVFVENQQPTAFKVLGILPGLVSYDTDSSDSDNDSDEFENNKVSSKELSSLSLARKKREIYDALKKKT